MRQTFIAQLEALNNDVIKMGSILELSTNEMILALDNTDTAISKKIIDRDDEIDLLEQQIEKDCINIIAKQQPLASDLRKITSIMKIITDIERIADHCVDISEYIIRLSKLPKVNPPKNLSDMISAMKKMVIGTIDSFVEGNLEKATKVIQADDEVDTYFEKITEELSETMQKDSNMVPQCICYLMIIKYLERMADHATNIAEWITFIVTGDLVIG
ncbi:phosphate transport system regulatory protein PhoU [Anaerocolumna cellulosilytica]|uniref:Phosphate-specific transport system accessory protein PhoU n=1 Tax=Anaerocolumna cellulosilytica TaxID=433286 RepID=A0A6S6RBH7_9FIRM|nr:phosphate signaling complex protein PhoU [Anaerocolumna cellulosilytica]MBB5197832.1 phosphate transport system protein [Anaerocolumna cellulosilytica]BCJ96248.1 phosphate transport system regulatory protein PhoU [Anaerocolumna cellulosilytica]